MVEPAEGEDVRYGPFVDVIKSMVGSRGSLQTSHNSWALKRQHLFPLPVKRGIPFDKATGRSCSKHEWFG